MLTPVLVALAGALLAWPGARSAARLSALNRGESGRVLPSADGIAVALVAATAAGAAGVAVVGPAGGAVALAFAAIGMRRWRERRASRERVAATREMSEALGALIGELRAGAHPTSAAESVAADCRGPAAAVLRGIASAARLGGEPDLSAVAVPAATVRGLDDVVDRLLGAWNLACRHGVPLIDVLDAVRRDVDAGIRFAGRLHARMAGPRASATVLATLPVVGLLLGEAMGAQPVGVLASSIAGQGLLVVGGSLIAAGTIWCARLTGRATL